MGTSTMSIITSFKYAQRFDFFITATESQKAVLENTLQKQGVTDAAIYALAVGHLENLSFPEGHRKPLMFDDGFAIGPT